LNSIHYDVPFTYPPTVDDKIRDVLNGLDFVTRYFIEREIATGKYKVLELISSHLHLLSLFIASLFSPQWADVTPKFANAWREKVATFRTHPNANYAWYVTPFHYST